MVGRSLRRSRRGWLLGTVAAIGFYLTQRATTPEAEFIEPQLWLAESGEYQLVRIRPDGLLIVQVETEAEGPRRAAIGLLGLQAPLSTECVSKLKELTRSATEIRLRFDRRRLSETSREYLAYVYIGEAMLNEELVRHGLAAAATHPSDAAPVSRRIEQAETFARRQQLGIWGLQ